MYIYIYIIHIYICILYIHIYIYTCIPICIWIVTEYNQSMAYSESDTKETIYLHQPRLLYLELVLPNPSHKQSADWFHNVWWWPRTGNDEHVVVGHRMHFPNGSSCASFLLHPIPSHANSRPIQQGTEMAGSPTNKTRQKSWNRRVCRFGWADTPQRMLIS